MYQVRVSIVIATYNRCHLLQGTLAAIAAQHFPRDCFEVIVADNASTDGTREVIESEARRFRGPRIICVHEAAPGKSHAVNAALAHVRGDLVAFTDDDVHPEPDWLSALMDAATAASADFVVGRILPIWEVPPPAWLSPSLYGILAVRDNGYARVPIARGVNEHIMPIGTNMAVRRAVLERLGGWRHDLGKFRGTLRSGEDHEFYLRLLAAGCQGVYEPEARVRHLVRSSRLQRRYFRQWSYENGQIVAMLEDVYPSTTSYLLGVPRYLWGEAARDVGRTTVGALTLRRADRFAAVVRLAWFVGYLRQAWWSDVSPRSSELPATTT
jgi:glucosyl-dolichyl phosphate glucuronosyltransferase